MALNNLGERANGWLRIASVIIPLIVAGLIAWGSLRSDVRYLSRELDRKADREVVQVQYERLLEELQSIRRQLEALNRMNGNGR